ncbi:MAG: hypothetical protein J6A15_09350 [Clostridia bacterium]|nr:hypothetical protein [Clostridia bacterium]
MINIFVISKNFDFCKKINNEINYNKNNERVNIINISSTYEEAIDNIIYFKPDIIIVDIKIKYSQILNLFEFINKKNFYLPKIILINNLELSSKISNYENILILDCESFLEDFNEILYDVLKGSNNEQFENKIINEMKKIGFEMKNKGEYYLVETIKYLKINRKYEFNLEREIYPFLAQKCNVDYRKIKWNINYAVDNLYHTKTKQVIKYLDIQLSEKPTSKFIIADILRKI